ncbi:MAG: CDP-alcohol phosphatidyltransferase family protein [Clostridia bacterium]|nr:CDP-alcohol phosphatidyltransferase family protein [Clostridia bacterium]
MIGVYDYTVILTYLSLLSAGSGIFVCLSGTGHPFMGIFFLLFCGLCDAFDGKVAQTKKNRTDTERKYGIQIDSLSDIVAFGVLPACIGMAFIRVSPMMQSIIGPHCNRWYNNVTRVAVFGVLALYILTALIRLAYYNVTEEERQETEDGTRKYYLGLPVTSAAIVFPFISLLLYVIPTDVTLLYIFMVALLAVLFIVPFQLRKVGLKGILVFVGIGAVEFIIILILTLQHSV